MDADRTAVFDGWASLVHGVNSGEHPTRLEERYVYRAINTTFRGGNSTTRPGTRKRELEFDNDFDKREFETGMFQGCAYYRTQAQRYIVCAINGWIFLVNPTTYKVINISVPLGQNAPDIYRMQFQQVDQYMIIQDGTNLPIILEGAASRRADPNKVSSYSVIPDLFDIGGDDPELLLVPEYHLKGEIPPAYFMAFGQGRLFWARRNSNEWEAGDIIFGGDPGNALMNTESEYLAEGGSFKLPAELGNITGMTFLQQIDTTLGIGPLMVQAEFGIAVYEVAAARNSWGDQVFGRVIYQGHGAVNPGSMQHYSNELYFLAKDGIRNVQQSRTDFETMIDTPLSREIEEDLNKSTPWMHHFCQSMLFGKRMFWTIMPQRHEMDSGEYDVHHRGLIVMDFDISSSLRQQQKPIFEGVWTGLKYLGLVSGVFGSEERGFAFALQSGKITLHEFTKDQHHDDGCRIPSRIYTRGFNFIKADRYDPVTAFDQKVLEHVDLWIESLKDEVDIEIYYKSDDIPEWNQLGETWKADAVYSYRHAPTDTNIPVATAYPVPEFQTCSSDDSPEKITERGRNTGYYFQLRIDITGHASIRQGRLKGKQRPSERTNAGHVSLPEVRLNYPPIEDFGYNRDDELCKLIGAIAEEVPLSDFSRPVGSTAVEEPLSGELCYIEFDDLGQRAPGLSDPAPPEAIAVANGWLGHQDTPGVYDFTYLNPNEFGNDGTYIHYQMSLGDTSAFVGAGDPTLYDMILMFRRLRGPMGPYAPASEPFTLLRTFDTPVDMRWWRSICLKAYNPNISLSNIVGEVRDSDDVIIPTTTVEVSEERNIEIRFTGDSDDRIEVKSFKLSFDSADFMAGDFGAYPNSHWTLSLSKFAGKHVSC